MALELLLPGDLEAKIRRYPELPEIAVRFLQEQVALREWRETRYSDRARQLVAASLAENSGEDSPGKPDEAVDDLMRVRERVTEYLSGAAK